MLIVYGGIRVQDARVSEVHDAGRAFEAECRNEEGCVEYVLSWRFDDPSRIQLLEAWETREAWETHKAQPHVADWTALISGAADGPPTFAHHEAE